MFPCLAAAFNIVGKLCEIFVHLVERKRELHAIVGHFLVSAHCIVQLFQVGSLAYVYMVKGLACGLCESLERLCMVFLDSGALLQEESKVSCRGKALLEALKKSL